MLHHIRLWHLKRRYRRGRILSRFLAPDIRRDVEVIDIAQIDAGLISVRTRTWNVLYAGKGIKPRPEFGDVEWIEVSHLWKSSRLPGRAETRY